MSSALIAIPFAGIALGYVSAANQGEFMVSRADPRRIVLAAYGTDAVCAALHVDGQTSWIARTFSLVDFKDADLGGFSREKIRTLEVKEP